MIHYLQKKKELTYVESKNISYTLQVPKKTQNSTKILWYPHIKEIIQIASEIA